MEPCRRRSDGEGCWGSVIEMWVRSGIPKYSPRNALAETRRFLFPNRVTAAKRPARSSALTAGNGHQTACALVWVVRLACHTSRKRRPAVGPRLALRHGLKTLLLAHNLLDPDTEVPLHHDNFAAGNDAIIYDNVDRF